MKSAEKQLDRRVPLSPGEVARAPIVDIGIEREMIDRLVSTGAAITKATMMTLHFRREQKSTGRMISELNMEPASSICETFVNGTRRNRNGAAKKS